MTQFLAHSFSALWERGFVEAQETWASHSMDITTDALKAPGLFELGTQCPQMMEMLTDADSSADEAGEWEVSTENIAVVESQLRQAMNDDEN